MTVAAFLDRWIEHMQGQVSPRSHERYAEIARKNIAPLLGGLMLTKLRPEQISVAYAKALASGRRDGQRYVACVAARSRRCAGDHWTLRRDTFVSSPASSKPKRAAARKKPSPAATALWRCRPCWSPSFGGIAPTRLRNCYSLA